VQERPGVRRPIYSSAQVLDANYQGESRADLFVAGMTLACAWVLPSQSLGGEMRFAPSGYPASTARPQSPVVLLHAQ